MQQMFKDFSDPRNSDSGGQIPLVGIQRKTQVKTYKDGDINCRGLPQGIRIKKRPNWPFLIYEESGVQYLNPSDQKSLYTEATTLGEALL